MSKLNEIKVPNSIVNTYCPLTQYLCQRNCMLYDKQASECKLAITAYRLSEISLTLVRLVNILERMENPFR